MQRPFVQDNTPNHMLFSKFCENLFVKVQIIFWSENQEEEKISVVATVQVYLNNTDTTIKESSTIAPPVHVWF